MRVIISNGLPAHATGDFPNAHDPVGIRAQHHKFEMPLRPQLAAATRPLNFWQFGVAVNGVPFDPSGPFWNGDTSSGWQFEVLCPANAVALGIDVNRAHTRAEECTITTVCPRGCSGSCVPRPDRPMHLLGYAADGFPIYGPDGPADATDLRSSTRRLRSSYRLGGAPRQWSEGTARRHVRRRFRVRCRARRSGPMQWPFGAHARVSRRNLSLRSH